MKAAIAITDPIGFAMASFVFVMDTPRQQMNTAISRALETVTRNSTKLSSTTVGIVKILVSWLKPTLLKARLRLPDTMLKVKKADRGRILRKGARIGSNRRIEVGRHALASMSTTKVARKW